MSSACLLLAGIALAAPMAAQVSSSRNSGPQKMQLRVERREGNAWRTVDPALIFANDDRLRFRFQTNFDGYLYVLNKGTSGEFTLLFPTKESGERNRIVAGREYVVPATDGSFRVTGPAGQDVIYWMITPLELGPGGGKSGYVPLPPPPKHGTALSTLTPRCDDVVLRARGECIDSTAGVRSLGAEESLPENLKSVPGLRSRELVFIREKETAVVSSPVPMEGPVVYEYRLAHK
ncbi:MAG: DUF4384 domain-containing protein [Bryobacteraceae bacterium]